MCKTLIILILLFDGTLIKEEYPLARPMEVHECLLFADDHREAIATYKEFNDAMKNANKIGYPILVKAASGGGGKGMKIIKSSDDLKNAMNLAKLEAKKAFDDDKIYLEKYLE